MELISASYYPLAVGLIAIILVVKIMIFKRAKSVNTRFYNLLFYPPGNINHTNSTAKQRLKLQQNLLTLLIILVLVFLYMDDIYILLTK